MAKGKSFKGQLEGNPAADYYISKPEAAPKEETAPVKKVTDAPKPPKGYKVNYEYVETRSRRAQFLLQPSVYAKLQEKAKDEGISVNELVNTIIKEALGE